MIGWLLTALVIAGFIAAFVAQRRRKANQVPLHHVILVDGFPVTHVPLQAVSGVLEAQGVVEQLKVAYRASWAALTGIYGATVREMPIDVIGMSTDPVSKKHPEVVWFVPTGKMRLRFQKAMYYYFVGELHNMFRFNMYGIEWIYKAKDSKDRKRSIEAQEWIEKNYGGFG